MAPVMGLPKALEAAARVRIVELNGEAEAEATLASPPRLTAFPTGAAPARSEHPAQTLSGPCGAPPPGGRRLLPSWRGAIRRLS